MALAISQAVSNTVITSDVVGSSHRTHQSLSIFKENIKGQKENLIRGAPKSLQPLFVIGALK